jgi:hypothetical protein
MSDGETIDIVTWETCGGVEFRLRGEHQQGEQWRMVLQSRQDSDEWDDHFTSGACDGLDFGDT